MLMEMCTTGNGKKIWPKALVFTIGNKEHVMKVSGRRTSSMVGVEKLGLTMLNTKETGATPITLGGPLKTKL